jgi:putative spermidine/putrescine transport system permease protein
MNETKKGLIDGNRIKKMFNGRNPTYLILPLLIYLALCYVYPIIEMIGRSFFDPGLTLKHYRNFIDSPVYQNVMLNTFSTAFFTTLICLFFGYMIAYLLTIVSSRTAQILVIFIMVPFWISVLVRSFAWMVLLGRNGILNQVLMKTGVLQSPLSLMHNRFGLYVGMINILLPFMILPLFSVMKGIDRDLLKAAHILGAPPWKAFAKVFFPLSLPGVAGGSLLVFIIALGFFITPALLGGPKDVMISLLIQGQVEDFVNWGFASALSTILLAITMIFLLIYNRLLGMDKLLGR